MSLQYQHSPSLSMPKARFIALVITGCYTWDNQPSNKREKGPMRMT
jgi:hypothetical protein